MEKLKLTTKCLVGVEKNKVLYFNDFNSLSEAELNWKPEKKVWSIGQNIEHVIKVNKQYFKILEAVLTQTYASGFMTKQPFMHKTWAKVLINAVDPKKRSKKIKTFKLFEPQQSKISRSVLTDFLNNQEALRKYVLELDYAKYHDKIIASPASKMFTFSLGTALEMLVMHTKRHYLQAMDLKKVFPSQVK
ncbi:MAG: DinB family protein [Saprospiraceae bacterium]|nr:DinB family protein [Saprospiraceae bacterium]